MAAMFPGAIRLYTGKVDLVTTVLAEHVNLLQDEVTAVETTLGLGTLTSTWGGSFDGTSTTHASVAARLSNIEAGILSRADTATAVTLAGSQTLTNKAMSGASNTFSAIPQSAISSLTTDLGLKAPLASPDLTGNPTAPTQTAGNSSTRLATTAFVGGAISTAVGNHEADTTSVHGIADTSVLLTTTSSSTVTGKTMSGASNTFSAIPQSAITNLAADLALKSDRVSEIISDLTISANVLTIDSSATNVAYVSSAPGANFTVNVTNLATTNGKVATFSVFVVQGATGYIPSALQVAGSAQTIKWQGGSAPTPTSTSGKIDVFSFSLVRRGSAWEVLGSALVKF